MDGIFLLLGSNVGERLNNLQEAISELKDRKIEIIEKSSVFETEPWGRSNQDWFLNVVTKIETTENPESLLRMCLDAETSLGRKREVKWGPREIDIDILYFNDIIFQSENLKVPHPGIPNRRFTLLPMVELGANMKHPGSGKTQQELLEDCDDELRVVKTELKI